MSLCLGIIKTTEWKRLSHDESIRISGWSLFPVARESLAKVVARLREAQRSRKPKLMHRGSNVLA